MAFDKVVDSSVLDAGLKTIADAIRAKGGTSDNLAFPTAMAEAIAAIQAGEGDNENNVNIQNCTSVFGGSFVAAKDYSGSVRFPSGKTFGEVLPDVSSNSIDRIGVLLADTTLLNDTSDFINCIGFVYYTHIGPGTVYSGGISRSSSGNVNLQTDVGTIVNQSNSTSSFSASDDICFTVKCGTNKKLLAGHNYFIMFFIRKEPE